MKLFLDVFTGDELCSDAYPIKVVDDLYYEVEGKVSRKKSRKFSIKEKNFSFCVFFSRILHKAMISMIH